VVSTAAAGGQILLDAATFAAVKGEAWRLGAVLAHGLDYDLLRKGFTSSSSSSSSRGGGGRGGDDDGEGWKRSPGKWLMRFFFGPG
jgi:hypothetical protein